jgi:hypothetical protein
MGVKAHIDPCLTLISGCLIIFIRALFTGYCCIVFVRSRVQILALRPGVLTQGFSGFPHSLQDNAGTVL